MEQSEALDFLTDYIRLTFADGYDGQFALGRMGFPISRRTGGESFVRFDPKHEETFFTVLETVLGTERTENIRARFKGGA